MAGGQSARHAFGFPMGPLTDASDQGWLTARQSSGGGSGMVSLGIHLR